MPDYLCCKNPAEVGTVCLVGYKKELFSYVNAGEEIAEIRVETDAAAKEELKKKWNVKKRVSVMREHLKMKKRQPADKKR